MDMEMVMIDRPLVEMNEGDIEPEIENCEICTNVVIDRGVLDCCDHWFCFACIDKWSIITNLCPTCKSVFQFITCLPVYDTIGNTSSENFSIESDDDWFVQGSNNTLFFPSYYIDESKVKCLDGDACKTRNRIPCDDVDPNLETSIACDSCELWYHASCVNVDPEFPPEPPWLCPRCIEDEVPQNIVAFPSGKEPGFRIDDLGWSADPSFSERVSVSLADDGETALVVSLIEPKKENETSKCLPPIFLSDVEKDKETEGLVLMSDADGIEETHGDMQLNAALQGKCLEDGNVEEGCMAFSPPSCASLEAQIEHSDIISFHTLPTSLPMTSISDEDFVRVGLKDHIIGSNNAHPAEGSAISDKKLCMDETRNDEEMGKPSSKGLAQITGFDDCLTVKRKRDSIDNIEISSPFKKTSSVEKSLVLSFSGKRNFTSATFCEWDKSNISSNKEAIPPDITSIVQENDQRLNRKQDGAAGLKVKKIMRVDVNKKSSVLVQKLGLKVGNTVHDKTFNTPGKNDFSEELFKAFRAAILEPENIVENGFGPPSLRMRKLLLQKGKSRENLTKKIYASSSGRRKPAWDREWEVEFWKHRCMKKKSGKAEPLKSVLEFLKKATGLCSNDSEMELGPGYDPKNSILSRVYPADTSVFPRKDDVKPLSSLEQVENGIDEEHNNLLNSKRPSEVKLSSYVSSCKAAYVRGNVDGLPKRDNLRSVSNKFATSSETTKDSIKTDKRTWALEFLSRQNALTNVDTNKGSLEDKSPLKGNYPLLAQLPADMRPMPAPSHCNKMPIAIREAQLFRITEHFLRKTNLSTIRRCAETELAVADAINVEKEIAEKSKSKLVYTNLCAQALSQRQGKSCRPKELEQVRIEADKTKVSDLEAEVCEEKNSCQVKGEELRMTGLSESLLNSPNGLLKMSKDESADAVNVPERDTRNEAIFSPCSTQIPEKLYRPEPVCVEEGKTKVSDLEAKVCEDTNSCPVKEALRMAGLSESPPTSPNMWMKTSEDKSAEAANAPEKDPGSKVIFPHPASQIPEKQCDVLDPHAAIIGSADDNHKKLKTLEASLMSSTFFGSQKVNTVLDLSMNDSAAEPSKVTSNIDSFAICEHLDDADIEPLIIGPCDPIIPDVTSFMDKNEPVKHGNGELHQETQSSGNNFGGSEVSLGHKSSVGKGSPDGSLHGKITPKDLNFNPNVDEPDQVKSISRKVEAYVKEHLRPLCKSGVITVEKYRWAVSKTRDKVMKHHSKARDAAFLIKEGSKVKKLAQEYATMAAARQRDC